MARFKFGKRKKDGHLDGHSNGFSNGQDTSIDEESNALFENGRGTSSEDHHNNHAPAGPELEYNHSPVLVKQPTPPFDPNVSPWTKFKLQNSPFPRYRHSASSISSEKNEIFLMGGLKEGSVFGDTWKVMPQVMGDRVVGYGAENVVIANNNHPPARVGHSSVLIGNAYIIYGGDTVDTDFNGFPDNNFYLFNINNNKYTIPSHILNKPNGRYGHTIGVVSLNNQSSRLYLFGGQLENDVFNDLYYFELNTFKSPKARWEYVEPLNNFRPPPLTNHSMTVYKNKIYIFGGVYNNEKVSNDLWSFDISSSKWSQIATSGNIPLPVNEHSATVIHDKMFVYGGNDFSGIIYNSLYVLDLHTLVWSKLISEGETNGPGSRCGHTMTYIPNLNKLVIMGGDKNDYVSNDENDFETYETKDPSVESNTMIYQLDLTLVDPFLSSKQTVVKATKKALASNGIDMPVVPGATTSGYGNAGVSIGAAAGAIGAAGAASGGFRASASPAPVPAPISASTPSQNVGSSNSQKAEVARGFSSDSFQRHARSFSNGPEDFRTPEASPERKQSDYQGDKFVEVPSTTISMRDNTEDEASLDEIQIPGSKQAGHHNGNSYLDDARLEGSSTPDLSKNVEAKTIENEKIKQLVSQLTQQLNSLKQSTKLEMQNATERINQLETENQSLKQSNAEDLRQQILERDEIIRELKQQVDPSLLSIDEEGEGERELNSNSVNELTKFKLNRLDLNNKLIYLTQENANLSKKINEFEPFMNNQVGKLSDFQKVIGKQEEKIKILTLQVKDQEVLNKELNNWQTKYSNLELEFTNYKSIHDNEEISDDEEFEEEANDGTNKSILSNSTAKRSKKDIANQLENLVQAWNSRTVTSAGVKEVSGEGDVVVPQLQKQLDQLMKISKEQETTSAREIANLRTELNSKVQNLRTFEDNYKDALQSVNNTSKALNLTQEELNNQKQLMEKLVKENNELKLFKRASKRTSTKNPLQYGQADFSSPAIKEEEEDDDSIIENAHYNMKLKDLEADLYILKQERDQLKDNVTSLQKQLYLSQNGSP